ncbi:MAG: hypothetical protein M3Z29_03320, partial [Pseudomonadota bacterium]|nr:hypothetical protein [Pseudomonadota bacterium]
MKHFDQGTHGSMVRAVALVLATAAGVGSAQARVTQMVIDNITAVTGGLIPYQTLRGRAFGVLDPADAHNAVITDIQLGKDPDGKVRYEATFAITRPVDPNQASGFMWHDVPNRGGAITIVGTERDLGDIGLSSAWQADNAGATGIPTVHSSGSNHWVRVPMARDAQGQLVTGQVLGRIVNRSGVDSAPLNVMGNPVPYLPASLNTADSVLTTHTKETVDGQISVGSVIAPGDWSFGHCSASVPFPGTP